MKLEGKAKMLRIHFGEDDKWHGKPLYQAIVEKCQRTRRCRSNGLSRHRRLRRQHADSPRSSAQVFRSPNYGLGCRYAREHRQAPACAGSRWWMRV